MKPKLTRNKSIDIIEYAMLIEEIQFSTGNPVPYEVYITQDKDFIKRYVHEIYELIQRSYVNSGNKSIRSVNDIYASNIVKLVFNAKAQIIALTLYRDGLGGHKRFCSASRKEDPQHKDAVQAIIKNDIEPYDNWFWGETSGPIEHYFKKHHGNPIPNYLVHKFLQKPKKDIVELNPDGVHYKRFLYSGDIEPTEKLMFGFKDQRSMDLVMKHIDNYGQFKIDVDEAVNDLHESEDDVTEDDKSFDAAIIFINELEERYEVGFNEMLPSWKEQLEHAIERLLKEQKKPDCSEYAKSMINANLKLAKHLIQQMPLLKFRQFHLEK